MAGPSPFPSVSNNPSKIQLERIAHVYYDHPDLDAFHQFSSDFGLVEAYRDDDHILYRGYGIDPFCYVARRAKTKSPIFRGAAWIAQSQADFDKAAALKGAVVTDLAPFPGAGKRVSVETPSGFQIHIVYGQEERVPAEEPVSAQIDEVGPPNGSLSKRRYGEFQRFHPGPALVHKLGHYGFILNNWDEEMHWYTENFNLVPSDVQHAPDNENLDVIAFMHLDLGERFSDHHSIFLSRAPPGEHDRVHHASFEVEDFDTQLLGHDWLATKGYTSVWGVGRHVLGSQIFDYWRDTTGFTIEHYADGDLVNSKTGTIRSKAGPLAVWGPEMSSIMFEDGIKVKDTAPGLGP